MSVVAEGLSEGYRDSRFGTPSQSDFNQDHEGHWDYTADQILRNLAQWIRDNPPDVVLVHVGSNDIFEAKVLLPQLQRLVR